MSSQVHQFIVNFTSISGAGVPEGSPHRGNMGLRGHRHPAAGHGQLPRLPRLSQPQGRRVRQVQVCRRSGTRHERFKRTETFSPTHQSGTILL